MPKVVDHEDRRRQLARAACRVVGAGGLDALTTRAVAREAGWSTGVLAHYFQSRDELVIAAFRLVAEEAGSRIEGMLAKQPSPTERLWITLSQAAPLDDVRRTEARVWFTFLGLAAGDEALSREAASRYAIWLRLVQDALLGVGRSPADAASDARRLIAFVDGLTVQTLFDATALPPQELTRHLRWFVERGLGITLA
jgi:AcrR family transcriptional regulator